MDCRFCNTPLEHVFADLGHAPPSNSFLKQADLNAAEVYYPLKIWTCEKCFLTQIDEFKSHSDIFSSDYVYYSSFSTSWINHARAYVEKMIPALGLGADSLVVEVASNDGYLLQFVQAAGVPCLGVEPTASTAAAARGKGIDTREDFFGTATARDIVAIRGQADLTAANNVLAHVPDIRDFVAGFKILLKPDGVATFEFPHLLELVRNNQFDTVYHEHFSYLSLLTVMDIFAAAGLKIFDVEQLWTHGGSLRLYATHEENTRPVTPAVADVLAMEREAGMDDMAFYSGFQKHIDKVRDDFCHFVTTARQAGKKICAYGAAAKGNTLLNYCGLRHGMVDFVCDLSPHKQGLYLPGSHVAVLPESAIYAEKPDYIVILPWNLRDEITAQLQDARAWGAKFVVAIPRLEVF